MLNEIIEEDLYTVQVHVHVPLWNLAYMCMPMLHEYATLNFSWVNLKLLSSAHPILIYFQKAVNYKIFPLFEIFLQVKVWNMRVGKPSND